MLAVEMHQVAVDSNDMSFDLELTLARSALCVEPLDPILLQVGEQLSLDIDVHDPDLPAPNHAFALADAPAGMTIDAAGLLAWTADAGHAGRSFPVRVQVVDGPHTAELEVPVQVAGPIVIDEWKLRDNTVRFPALPGKTYVVEYKNHLTDPAWTVLRTITATGATVQAPDPAAATVECRYYRVGIVP